MRSQSCLGTRSSGAASTGSRKSVGTCPWERGRPDRAPRGYAETMVNDLCNAPLRVRHRPLAVEAWSGGER